VCGFHTVPVWCSEELICHLRIRRMALAKERSLVVLLFVYTFWIITSFRYYIKMSILNEGF